MIDRLNPEPEVEAVSERYACSEWDAKQDCIEIFLKDLGGTSQIHEAYPKATFEVTLREEEYFELLAIESISRM